MTHPLMGYIPQAQPAQSQPAADGALKYTGAVADGYDAKRESSAKWQAEQRIIEEMLSDLPGPDESGKPRTTILDVPVGTGRFLDFYRAKGFHFIGADLSGDMLVKAALKLAPEEEVERWVAASNKAGKILAAQFDGGNVMLVHGDVRAIGLADNSVDAALMVRLSRWLEPGDCQVAFRELQRVARKRVIWTARVANHPFARPVGLFEQALAPGWRIARNEAGHEPEYRVMCAERVGG